MWWRLNRDESNALMKQCINSQITHSLPWMMEINKIACKLNVDLEDAKKMSKEQWKTLVKGKVLTVATDEIKTEISRLKGYNSNLKDEIHIGKKKKVYST